MNVQINVSIPSSSSKHATVTHAGTAINFKRLKEVLSPNKTNLLITWDKDTGFYDWYRCEFEDNTRDDVVFRLPAKRRRRDDATE